MNRGRFSWAKIIGGNFRNLSQISAITILQLFNLENANATMTSKICKSFANLFSFRIKV